MSKIDFKRLKQPERSSFRYEFTDPAQSEPVVLHLRRLNAIEDEASSARAEYLIRKFVTGGFTNEVTDKWETEPFPFHDTEGNEVELNERIITFACKIEAMQSSAPASDRYSAEEIILLAPCFPDAWVQIRGVVFRLLEGYDPKALWEAFTGTSSAPESSLESDTQE